MKLDKFANEALGLIGFFSGAFMFLSLVFDGTALSLSNQFVFAILATANSAYYSDTKNRFETWNGINFILSGLLLIVLIATVENTPPGRLALWAQGYLIFVVTGVCLQFYLFASDGDESEVQTNDTQQETEEVELDLQEIPDKEPVKKYKDEDLV